MKTINIHWNFTLTACLIFFLTSCEGTQIKNHKEKKAESADEIAPKNMDTVYKTENLMLVKLSNHVYQHISFLNTNDFGRVSCNGMVVLNDHEAIIFDTPADGRSSQQLINFVTNNLESRIQEVIPTHFHNDCVGGMKEFNKNHILSMASNRTLHLLKRKGNKFAPLMKGFHDSLSLELGDKKVEVKYFGEGHTKDNIVGYFPADSILFGGCLIKELTAQKGNLEDANLIAWPETVKKLKQYYPDAKIIIPGHGKSGGTHLLDYTITLFTK